MKAKLVGLSLLLFSFASFGDVLVDFNTPGTLTSQFNGQAGGSKIIESPDEGLGGTGAVNLNNAGNPQIEIYNQQSYAGNLSSWKVGAYVELIGNEVRNFSLGLVNNTAAFVNGAYNGGYVQPSSDWRSIGISVNRFGDLRMYSNNQLLSSINLGVLASIDNPSWLYVEAAGGVDASGFNLSAGIFQSDSLGNKGNMIGSPLAVSGISNPDLLNTPAAYFFFGADNQSARALDNFQITVPEPSSFPLVCFFAFVHVIFRNRKR